MKSNGPLYRRETSEARGRHLVSTQDINEGQIIFVERPLLSLQSFGNSHTGALVCKRCRAFVGGPDLCVGVASGRIDREKIFDYGHDHTGSKISNCGHDGSGVCKPCVDEENFKGYDTTMVPCRNNCGEIFCSKACEEISWVEGGHRLLCTGLIPDSDDAAAEIDTGGSASKLHPLLQFKIFAIQNNEIFLMVADLIASVISRRRQQIETNWGISQENEGINTSLEQLMQPYLDFTLEPWWDVATHSSPSNSFESEEDQNETGPSNLSSNLRQLCREASALLKDAIFSIVESSPNHEECKETYDRYSGPIQDILYKLLMNVMFNMMCSAKTFLER